MTDNDKQEMLQYLRQQASKSVAQVPTVTNWNELSSLPATDKDGRVVRVSTKILDEALNGALRYGVEWDYAVETSTCTRIGSMELHKTLPIQNRMRGCLLNNDGSVTKYLDPNSWVNEPRDGSQGQVMVELPEFYIKFETEGTKRRVWMSEYELPGYTKMPKRYVSAYQATIDRETTTLASVVNLTARYRGGNNNAANDSDAVKSQLGKAASNTSLTNFREYAKKRNSGDVTGWGCMNYDTQKELYWLFVVEYATLNCQLAFNAALTGEGYKQGGLGGGVQIDWSSWGTKNGNYPISPCGHTDSLGNGSGEVNFDFGGTTVKVNRYRGIQNPFMDVWVWVDGILAVLENATAKTYVCHDPSKFADSVTTDYHLIGESPNADTWVKEVIFGAEGDIMCKVGNGAEQYHRDRYYAGGAASITTRTVRGVLFSGGAYYGSHGGFVYASLGYAPSNSYADVVSRLCFLPTE